MRLENLTWPKAQEYFEKNDMVLVSIGSIECHGRHMPLGTDTLQIICWRKSRRRVMF